jgi:hypothetical protein
MSGSHCVSRSNSFESLHLRKEVFPHMGILSEVCFWFKLQILGYNSGTTEKSHLTINWNCYLYQNSSFRWIKNALYLGNQVICFLPFKTFSTYLIFLFFCFFNLFIHYVHTLFGPFLPHLPYPLSLPPPSRFQAEPILPLSPILLKGRHKQ